MTTPVILGLGVVVAVRALRSGLLVGDDGVVQRGVLWGWELPWSEVTEVTVGPARPLAFVYFRSGSITRRSIQRDTSTLLADIAALRLRHPPGWPSPVTQANQRSRRIRGGILLGAAAVAVAGAISVQTGLKDRAHYTERAARDLATTADIVTWTVHDVEVSCAEYELGPCHRTRTDIDVRFTTADGRPIRASLGSWGAYERHGSTRLGIVYDPAVPTDVDFADRRNRRANDASAHVRLLLGPAAVVGGLLLLIAAAIFCVIVPLPRGLNEPDARSAVSNNRRTSVNHLQLGRAQAESEALSYRRPGWIRPGVQVAVGASIVSAGVAAAAYLADRRMIGRLVESPTSVSVEDITAADDRRLALSWVVLVLFVVSVGFMAAWTRRVYGNLGALGVTGMRFGVGWAIGGWFVPFLNFVRPKQIVDDTWRGTDPTVPSPHFWRDEKVPALLHAWWVVWIIGAVIRIGATQEPTDLDSLRVAMAVQALGLGMLAVGGLLTLVVVHRLTDRQERCAVVRLAVTPPGRRLPMAAAVGLPAVVGVVAFGATFAVLDGQSDADPVSDESVLATDLQVGDCFNQPGGLASAAVGDTVQVIGVDRVGCDTPHDSEMIALVEHPAAGDARYPGDDEMVAFAEEECAAAFEDAIGEPFSDSVLELTYFWPIGTWGQGDRVVRCAATHPSGRRREGSVLVSSLPTPSTLADPVLTSPRPSTSVRSTTTAAPIATAAEAAANQLPAVPGYEYRTWAQAEADAFLATLPADLVTRVESFTGADVRRDSELIGTLEVHVLRPQLRTMSGLDKLVLDLLSGYVYGDGQTTERLGLPGEEVLVRRVPRLVAWTWVEDGVVYTVVASGIDPGPAGDFVTATSAIQQGVPIPTQTST